MDEDTLGADAGTPVVVRVVSLTMAVSLVAGLAAAVIGGPLEGLGQGFGGLQGAPGVLLLLCAVAGPVSAWRRPRPRPWVAVGLWPLVVLLAFSGLAHALDPCGLGLFDLGSRLGEQPLCERFGPYVDVHTRFHLGLHGTVGAGAVLVARRVWPVWRSALRARAGASAPPSVPT